MAQPTGPLRINAPAAAPAELPPDIRSIIAQQDQLQGVLCAHVDSIEDAVSHERDVSAKRKALQAFLTHELLPRLSAEEDSVYLAGAALPRLKPLVDGLILEHDALRNRAAEVAEGETALAVALAATALLALFEVHAAKDNDLLLPALVAGGADPKELRRIMQNASENHQPAAESAVDAGAIDATGLHARTGEQVVDTRIDSAGSCAALATEAVDSLRVGGSFILVADHDPRGINYMLRAERPGSASWDVLEDGPERWQVRIGKAALSR